MKYFW